MAEMTPEEATQAFMQAVSAQLRYHRLALQKLAEITEEMHQEVEGLRDEMKRLRDDG